MKNNPHKKRKWGILQFKSGIYKREVMISKIPLAENKMREIFNLGCTHPDDNGLETDG